MKPYIIDTHAWVEYFRASKKAETFRKMVLDVRYQFITLECSASELKLWAMRHNLEFDRFCEIVQSNSTLVPVDLELWLSGASIRQEMRKTRKDFGLIDALLLAHQRGQSCNLISGDPHFKGLPGVMFLG